MDLQGLKLILAPPAWTVLCKLVRLPTHSPESTPVDGPWIFACLHRDILPAIMYVRPAHPALMVSHSPDGDILVKTLGSRGYRFVRGATGEGGGRALVGLRRELENGHSVGVAVDGPKGPYGAIHDGVLHLARLTGAPIVPLRAFNRHALVLGTWDRTVVPLPLGGTVIREGEPLRVAGSEDHDRVRASLARYFGVGKVAS